MRQLTQAIQDKLFADRVLRMADMSYVEDVWHSTRPSISQLQDFLSDAPDSEVLKCNFATVHQ